MKKYSLTEIDLLRRFAEINKPTRYLETNTYFHERENTIENEVRTLMFGGISLDDVKRQCEKEIKELSQKIEEEKKSVIEGLRGKVKLKIEYSWERGGDTIIRYEFIQLEKIADVKSLAKSFIDDDEYLKDFEIMPITKGDENYSASSFSSSLIGKKGGYERLMSDLPPKS